MPSNDDGVLNSNVSAHSQGVVKNSLLDLHSECCTLTLKVNFKNMLLKRNISWFSIVSRHL